MSVSQAMPDVTGVSQFWRTSEKIWLPTWKNQSGTPIAVSTGRIPIKPYYECHTIAIYHFVRFKTYNDGAFKSEIDSLNSGGWRGWGAHQAWISEIHTRGVDTIGGTTGEQVHYVVRCLKRTDGWRFQHPDVGYIFESGADVKSFVSDEGLPYIGNLDGSGGDGGGTLTITLDDTKETIDFNGVVGLN